MARMNEAMNNLLRYNAALLPKFRSTFNRSHSKSTTFDSSYLIPIMIDEILPGDEVKISIDSIVRMSTPLFPTMDTAYLDIAAFYSPTRLLWDNAKAFYGENLDAEFNALGEYEKPSFSYAATGGAYDTLVPEWNSGSLLDYMELPNLQSGIQYDVVSPKVDLLPFRFYQKTWNEWYRASEIQSSVRMNYGNQLTSDEASSVFELRKVNKLHDYFTSLLPSPQAGFSVSLPLGSAAPVVVGVPRDLSTQVGGLEYAILDEDMEQDSTRKAFYNLTTSNLQLLSGSLDPDDEESSNFRYIVPNNLYADLQQASAATINNLRTAITIQQALEIDAAGGTRYNSLIRSHFGVLTPDDVVQRTELLGHVRETIGMRSVAQTSESTATSKLGNLGAYSATRIQNGFLVNKAFTEPGYLMVVCCVRPIHTYSQGIPEMYRKLSRFDHYMPVFANIGNQPVLTSSIYLGDVYGDESQTSFNAAIDSVFGYKEAWNEYRVKQNAVTGLFRPDVPGSLATWNYADYYEEQPLLNSSFIEEDENLIGRTIAVQNEPQFLGDFYFEYLHTRVMPVHSIPGLTRL